MGPIKCSLSVMDWNQQVYPCTSATWRDSGNWVIILIIIYSWLTWLFWPAAISRVPSMAVQRLHVMGTGEPFDCYQHCHGQAKIYIFLILTNTLHHLHQSRYGFLSMLYVNEKKIKFTGIQVYWIIQSRKSGSHFVVTWPLNWLVTCFCWSSMLLRKCSCLYLWTIPILWRYSRPCKISHRMADTNGSHMPSGKLFFNMSAQDPS